MKTIPTLMTASCVLLLGFGITTSILAAPSQSVQQTDKSVTPVSEISMGNFGKTCNGPQLPKQNAECAKFKTAAKAKAAAAAQIAPLI